MCPYTDTWLALVCTPNHHQIYRRLVVGLAVPEPPNHSGQNHPSQSAESPSHGPSRINSPTYI